MIDVAKDNLPFVPDWLERMMQSTKYKLYNTNKINFSTAQLRRETGAVINDSEIVWIEETYFPQLGDGPEVASLKKEARTEAIRAMETEAGAAYQGLSQEETLLKAAADAKRRAISILKKRAETNPELADEIRAIISKVRTSG
jgi:tryptophan synthase beta subunit